MGDESGAVDVVDVVDVVVSTEVVSEAVGLTAERLEAELCLLAAHDASLAYRRMVMIAEFDTRDLAGTWGMPSTARWLSWRTALDARTAREQVRVARSLSRLPSISEAMARGELTYSKVRALTRFATPASEGDLVELATHATAAQLDVIAGFAVRGLEASSGTPASRESSFRTWIDESGMRVVLARLEPEDGAVVMAAIEAIVDAHRKEEAEERKSEAGAAGAEGGSAEPLEGGATDEGSGGRDGEKGGSAEPARAGGGGVAVLNGVEYPYEDDEEWWRNETADHVPQPGDPVFRDGAFVIYGDEDEDEDEVDGEGLDGGSAEPPSSAEQLAPVVDIGRRQADALVTMAETLLSGGPASGLASDRFLINVMADVSVLDGVVGEGVQLNLLDDGTAISSATVRRLACDEPLALVLTDKEGNPLFMGRKVRLATRRQRRAALARSNGMCEFPACERKHLVQIHHCGEWNEGGPTDIDNLAPVCRYHHWCLHEGGFTVKVGPGGFEFYTPSGQRILEAPPLVDDLTLEQIREHLARPLRRQPQVDAPAPGDGERMDLDITMTSVFCLLARDDPRAA